MESGYIARSLEPVLEKAVSEFPAVVLIGPRQSGKTTLLQHLFSDRIPLVSLEAPDMRAAASSDPRGFLAFYPPPVIFDEVQHVPGLLPYIKERVDAERDRPGQYILTGSQNLLLMQQITESLAGRAAVLTLLPLSQREISGEPHAPLAWERSEPAAGSSAVDFSDLWTGILRGSYPELVKNPQRDIRLWQASYVQTYLERDVRNLRNVGDLTLFQLFLRALANRCAQLLNLSELAREVGVSVSTARDWLSLLEATFQVFLVRPYHENLGKRLVKSPKVYFVDSGILCYLVGLRDPLHAAAGPLGGAIFENLTAGEIYKRLVHRGEEARLYFWRTAAGMEVDFLLEQAGQVIPVEAKLSATPRPAMARPIAAFMKEEERAAGLRRCAPAGYVVHPGSVRMPLGEGVIALPFSQL